MFVGRKGINPGFVDRIIKSKIIAIINVLFFIFFDITISPLYFIYDWCYSVYGLTKYPFINISKLAAGRRKTM
jgi:hypothetical protein